MKKKSFDLIAFIPIRGGSKSIPLKNIKKIAGRPLVFWAIDSLINISDKVCVYTDSEEIKNNIKKYYDPENKIILMDRPLETATDDASSEIALVDFCSKVNNKIIVFVQATSPLIDEKSIVKGLEYIDNKYDSVLSGVRQKRFLWGKNKDVYEPRNYDYNNRPRRQEFEGFLVENGAFYISGRENITESKCRISGKIGFVEMPEETYYEIDEVKDWIIVEDLLIQRLKKSKIHDEIKLIVLDNDGVLTDGSMYYDEKGEFLKRFNTKDGMGFQKAKEVGVEIVVVTGEENLLNAKRMEKLKVKEFYQGIKDKYSVLNKIIKNKNIKYSNVAYIGDDINDLTCIYASGISFCPNNAEFKIKKEVDVILKRDGGAGAVREAIEYVLEYNDRIRRK